MWKLKLDDKGNAVLDKDGLPTYIMTDGKEVVYNVNDANERIKSLNGEAMGARQAKEKAEKELKKFEGIENPEDAVKALQIVSTLDDKDKEHIEKFETMKSTITKQYETKMVEKDKENSTLKKENRSILLTSAFSTSKYIKEKIAVPADMFQSMFGSRFEVVEGKVIANDANGQPLLSVTDVGNKANFEESLEIIVNGYSNKNAILKGSSSSGTGSTGSEDGNSGKMIYKRADFDKLSGSERGKIAKAANEGKALIQD